MPQAIALVGAATSIGMGAGAWTAAATMGIGAKIAAGAMIAGGVMTGVGAVTKNQKLMKWGSVLSVAGGLGSAAAGTLPGMGGGGSSGGAAGGGSMAPVSDASIIDAATGSVSAPVTGGSAIQGAQTLAPAESGLLGTATAAPKFDINSILAKSPGTQSVARAMANAPAQSSTGLLGTINKGVGYIQQNKDAFKLLGEVAAPIAQHLGEQDERKQFMKMRDRERQTFNDSIRNLRIPTLTVTRGV